MNAITNAVAAHASTIKDADQKFKAARIAEARRQLVEVQAGGRTTKLALAKALKELERGELDVLEVKTELAKIDAALADCAEPDLLDFPSERQLADVHVEQARLGELRRKAVEQLRERNRATSEPRLRAINLDMELVNLKRTAQHLVSVINDEEGAWAKNSVTTVA